MTWRIRKIHIFLHSAPSNRRKVTFSTVSAHPHGVFFISQEEFSYDIKKHSSVHPAISSNKTPECISPYSPTLSAYLILNTRFKELLILSSLMVPSCTASTTPS